MQRITEAGFKRPKLSPFSLHREVELSYSGKTPKEGWSRDFVARDIPVDRGKGGYNSATSNLPRWLPQGILKLWTDDRGSKKGGKGASLRFSYQWR